MIDEMTGNATSRALALRFGAGRLCLWRLCGNRICRRAQACRGDPRRCTGLLGDWLAAVDAEARLRGLFAPPEGEIKTLAEARAYLAWRACAGRAATDTKTDSEHEADRLRLDLARRLEALQQQHEAESNVEDA